MTDLLNKPIQGHYVGNKSPFLPLTTLTILLQVSGDTD